MKTLRIETNQRAYDMLIGKGLLASVGEALSRRFPAAGSVMIVTDDAVAPLYLPALTISLESAGFKAHSFIFPHGEEQKTLSAVSAILEHMEEDGFLKSDLVAALGGGVAGDMAGLAAALYMRGIEFIQLPTTLLASQDSSVGGKTAVNLKSKNMVGSFWQPSLVMADTDVLSTLPEKIFADGMAEMIKHGAIKDSELFSMLENGAHRTDLEECIFRSVSVKAAVVAADERDTSVRRMLNFGHTVGHAIEKLSGFAVSHGSAVAIGMCIMAKASEKLGYAEPGTALRLESLVSACGLPTKTDFSADELFDAALSDKKRVGDNISLVLIRSIGNVFIKTENVSALREYIEAGI